MIYKIGFQGRKTKRVGQHKGEFFDIEEARRELSFYKRTYGKAYEFWIQPVDAKVEIDETLRVK